MKLEIHIALPVLAALSVLSDKTLSLTGTGMLDSRTLGHSIPNLLTLTNTSQLTDTSSVPKKGLQDVVSFAIVCPRSLRKKETIYVKEKPCV